MWVMLISKLWIIEIVFFWYRGGGQEDEDDIPAEEKA